MINHALYAADAQVLLCQSLPAISSMSVQAKWWLVVMGQAASVVASALPAVWPSVSMITACRAMHGAATAGNEFNVRPKAAVSHGTSRMQLLYFTSLQVQVMLYSMFAIN
jgi:hypothetical protein